MGRTKPDSIELENKPSDSHVARTDQDEFGHIFRRICHSETSTTMERCLSGSAPNRRGFPKCWKAWRA